MRTQQQITDIESRRLGAARGWGLGVGAQWFAKLPLFMMYPLRGELLGKSPVWVEAWQLLNRKKPEQKVASGPEASFSSEEAEGPSCKDSTGGERPEGTGVGGPVGSVVWSPPA